jgi:hypothetical protein
MEKGVPDFTENLKKSLSSLDRYSLEKSLIYKMTKNVENKNKNTNQLIIFLVISVKL